MAGFSFSIPKKKLIEELTVDPSGFLRIASDFEKEESNLPF
jgi:hypothetical protein